jgi:transposase InsO family protein
VEDGEFDPQKIAAFRFGIIGPLLAAPPERGSLITTLKDLSAKPWPRPGTGQPWHPSVRSLERWFYLALTNPKDPIGALRPMGRVLTGAGNSVSLELRQLLKEQYNEHKNWTTKLHFDNLTVVVAKAPALGPMPSYSTLSRYMKRQGLFRQKHWRTQHTAGQKAAERRKNTAEIRSYEAAHVGGLWHTDFHKARRKVLTQSGELQTPIALAIIDDHSRLICHMQWYFSETCDVAVHGLRQAILKRGLPRALMSDNGSAFIADEFVQGLGRLGVSHERILPHSPYQNAKQESFWGQLEGRLMAMLESLPNLDLRLLNEATMAWVEGEYNRAKHSEIDTTPLDRFLHGPSVMRDSPENDELRLAFRLDEERTQRRTDGTVVIESKRFEVPDRFRHLRKLQLRYARWDLSVVDIVDPRTTKIIAPIYPLDKEANASGVRRQRHDHVAGDDSAQSVTEGKIPPLLQKLMEDYAASGLLPAFLPKDDGVRI